VTYVAVHVSAALNKVGLDDRGKHWKSMLSVQGGIEVVGEDTSQLNFITWLLQRRQHKKKKKRTWVASRHTQP
jgi:hypothetical protein